MASGCGTNINDNKANPISDYCMIADPIRASSQDTLETKRQILRENTKYERLCK